MFGKKKNDDKKTTEQPDSRTVEQKNRKTEKKEQRKYFEVFGETINQLNFFKTLTVFLLMLCIFLVIIVRKSVNKLPLVIRVDSLGYAETAKYDKSILTASPVEISNFAQYFLQYFSAHNFYTYDEDFIKAFKMMTEECQRKLDDYIKIKNITANIKGNQEKTKLTITEIRTVKDSPDYINLKVKGNREIRSYQDVDFYREEIFEAELSIKKVERTEKTPWGLLIDSWNESLYKQTQ